LDVPVGFAEEIEQFANETGRSGVDGGNLFPDRRCGQRLVCQVQPDHHDGPLFIEDNVCGLGVDDDIEFGDGAPVADMVAAAHQHDLFDSFHYPGFFARRQCNIGEAARRDKRDRSGFVGHDDVDDQVDGMPLVQDQGRLRQDRSVQARFTMDGRGVLTLPHERASGAGRERDIRDAGDTGNRQRVAGHFLERLVPDNSRDGQQLNFRAAVRQQDGDRVIVAWVAVQNDLLRHGAPLHWGRCPPMGCGGCSVLSRSMRLVDA
jgi:hypothetical protein